MLTILNFHNIFVVLQALEEQLSQKLEEIARVSSEKEALNQKVADNVQDMKLHEKKGASLVKSLISCELQRLG